MNKKTFIEAYKAKVEGVTTKAAGEIYDNVFAILGDALKKGESIAIKDFGSFKLKAKKATTCKNPKTGEAIDVPASTVVKFKPAASLKAGVADIEI
jgi:nucleoid DNA-binding protein